MGKTLTPYIGRFRRDFRGCRRRNVHIFRLTKKPRRSGALRMMEEICLFVSIYTAGETFDA